MTKENDRSTVRHMNEITSNDTRDIILDVTEKLIYKSGIAATGMDLLVKTAGVSRKSIYRYFTTKDELVVAALQRRDLRWMHWFTSEVGKAPTPAARLLNLFTVLGDWFASEDFRGCAFINTSGETGDPQDPVRVVAREHKQKLLDYVLELCKAHIAEKHGTEDPEEQARQLLILIDGAITVALVMGDRSAADNAQCMARKLLDL
ncbi:transcriptional regulator, TetR family [Pseudomonas chlororaphis subsp. aurantiaca]|nr:transcriptional regulator, TetR family [Pseudomonas chlororaphis subsp. aurantiaca]